MLITLLLKDKTQFQSGITFVSKKVLQYAVILLGFGLNLSVILETGKQSLPIILATISTSLIIAYVLHRVMHVPGKISTLVGVGSSICGGSAIAATAPLLMQMMKRLRRQFPLFSSSTCWLPCFPALGALLGFSTTSGEAFGIFAGTAVNDTSSVTAAASTWDSLYQLGTQTLDKAVTVKLTRTLAIIPITLVLAFVRTRKAGSEGKKSSLKDFPDVYSLLCAGFRHHNNRNLSRCFRIRIFSSQNTEQVLHRPRHVRGRFKYKHCKTHQNRR